MEHTFDFNEYGIVQSSREVYICWNVLKTNSTLRGLYGTIKSMLRKKRADYFNTKYLKSYLEHRSKLNHYQSTKAFRSFGTEQRSSSMTTVSSSTNVSS
jgi:hypothetical protein